MLPPANKSKVIRRVTEGENESLTAANQDRRERSTPLVHASGGLELKKLSPTGHTFFHIDSPNEDFTCNTCHTGALPK